MILWRRRKINKLALELSIVTVYRRQACRGRDEQKTSPIVELLGVYENLGVFWYV